jgi:glucose/arabinose dehydrogenase
MNRPSEVFIVLASVLAFLSSACSDDGKRGHTRTPAGVTVDVSNATTSTASTTTTQPPPPQPSIAALAGVSVSLVSIVDGIKKATAVAWRAGDAAPYVTSQTGLIYRVDGGIASVVFDLTGEVPAYENGSEQGLLGIAFDPRDGRMFLHFNDRNGDTHVVSYANADGVIDPGSRRDVLFQDQPGAAHKGGQLAFDRTGNLYIALGDGSGSKGHTAQDMTTLLGAIVRIVPKLDGPGYDVPPDNPFVDTPGARPELWAKGLRNPWRFSIDESTGDMWIGDVGESTTEEVDVIPAGAPGLNFGWYHYEGSAAVEDNVPSGMTPPVYEYSHDAGIAVIGGYMYRGEAIPGLSGAYVFGDVNGTVWAMGFDGVVALPIRVEGTLSSFGQGPDGELYACSLSNGIFAIRPA